MLGLKAGVSKVSIMDQGENILGSWPTHSLFDTRFYPRGKTGWVEDVAPTVHKCRACLYPHQTPLTDADIHISQNLACLKYCCSVDFLKSIYLLGWAGS